MTTAKTYFSKYGLPLAFYSDKHSIFRINKPGCLKKDLITQFGRACKELDIESICANSRQAKGRVERNNRTQQDRLVKELRLAGISTIEKANKYLESNYWNAFNEKFVVPPTSAKDAHRPLLKEHDLKKILCQKSSGVLSKNLEVQYNNVIYQIAMKDPSWKLRKSTVTIITTLEGEIFIEHNGKNLPFKIFSEQEASGELIDRKSMDNFFKEKKERKVSDDHPWKKQARAASKKRKYKMVQSTLKK